MTVKEYLPHLYNPHYVAVSMDDKVYVLMDDDENSYDERLCEWLGDYIVSDLSAAGPCRFVLQVKMVPAKVEHTPSPFPRLEVLQ